MKGSSILYDFSFLSDKKNNDTIEDSPSRPFNPKSSLDVNQEKEKIKKDRRESDTGEPKLGVPLACGCHFPMFSSFLISFFYCHRVIRTGEIS